MLLTLTLLAALANAATGVPSSAPWAQSPNAPVLLTWDHGDPGLGSRFDLLVNRAYRLFDKNDDGVLDGDDWVRLSSREREEFVAFLALEHDYSVAVTGGATGPRTVDVSSQDARRTYGVDNYGYALALDELYAQPAHRHVDPFRALRLYVEPHELAARLYGRRDQPAFGFDAQGFADRWADLFPNAPPPFALQVPRTSYQAARGHMPAFQAFNLQFAAPGTEGRQVLGDAYSGVLATHNANGQIEYIALRAHRQFPAEERWSRACFAGLLRVVEPGLTTLEADSLVDRALRASHPVGTERLHVLEQPLGHVSLRWVGWQDGASLELIASSAPEFRLPASRLPSLSGVMFYPIP